MLLAFAPLHRGPVAWTQMRPGQRVSHSLQRTLPCRHTPAHGFTWL